MKDRDLAPVWLCSPLDFLHVCPNVIVGEVNLLATIAAVPTGSREAEIDCTVLE